MQSNTGHTVYGNPSSIPHVCSACRSAPRLSAASTLRYSLAPHCKALRLALGHTCYAVGSDVVAAGMRVRDCQSMQKGGGGRGDCCGLLIYSRLGIIPLFFFFFVPEFQSVGVLNIIFVYIQLLSFSTTYSKHHKQ